MHGGFITSGGRSLRAGISSGAERASGKQRPGADSRCCAGTDTAGWGQGTDRRLGSVPGSDREVFADADCHLWGHSTASGHVMLFCASRNLWMFCKEPLKEERCFYKAGDPTPDPSKGEGLRGI